MLERAGNMQYSSVTYQKRGKWRGIQQPQWLHMGHDMRNAKLTYPVIIGLQYYGHHGSASTFYYCDTPKFFPSSHAKVYYCQLLLLSAYW